MRNISQGRLSAMQVPVPPQMTQLAFAERFADVRAMIAQQERMAGAGEQLVASLMAQLFDRRAAPQDTIKAVAPAHA